MFIGLPISLFAILCYAIYVSNKYATKKEISKLELRIKELENRLEQK